MKANAPTAWACLLGIGLTLLIAGCTAGDDSQALVAKARASLAANDVKAAIIQAKSALQANAELPQARQLLGEALLRSGDGAGAEAELRRSLALGQPIEDVAPPLAQALLLQGQFRPLIAEFSDLGLKSAAALASLKTSLAAAHALDGEVEAAQAELTTALSADPDHAPALLLQARLKSAGGDEAGALAVLDSILQRAPGSHEAWQLRGDLLSRHKDQTDAALAAYRKAQQAKPGLITAQLGAMGLLVKQGDLAAAAAQLETLKQQHPSDARTRYFETLLAFERMDFDAAATLSAQLLALAPNDPRNLQLAGNIALQRNELVQAQQLLERLVQAAPKSRLGRQLLVTTYLRSGQTAKATAALQPMLAGGEPDADTSTLAGDVYRRAGDLAKARAYFAKAAKLAPDSARARTSLALADLAIGQREQALDSLQEVSSSSSDITADLALFATHLLRKDFAAAHKAIDAIEKKLPDKPVAARLHGRTQMIEGDLVAARKSYERALAIDANYFAAIEGLTSIDMLEGKPQDARQRIETVLAKHPTHLMALLALATQRRLAEAPKDEVAAILERAVAAAPMSVSTRMALFNLQLRARDYPEALAAARSGVAANPSSALLLEALGRAQLASGDSLQALASYGKAAALQPQSVAPHMLAAQAHLADKNKTAAAASLRKALALRRDLLAAQTLLMDIAVDGKDFAAARELARTVQQQRPREAIGYLLEAEQALAQNRADQAVAVLRDGLKSTALPALAKKLHSVLGAAGKPEEAQRFAAAWSRDHPQDPQFQLYLGDMAAAHGDMVAAEKFYGGVTQFDPGNVIAFNNLAWVGGQLGRASAIGHARTALSLAPQHVQSMDTLAMLLSAKGDYANALAWENKALALQPENGLMKLNLAKIHAHGGRKDLARQQLEQLAKLGNAFPAQAEVARLMKAL